MVSYREPDKSVKSLMNIMQQSPTGSQVVIDGSFVMDYVEVDPSLSILSPPDGTVIMWNDSGTLRLRAYSRDTGWQTI